MSVFHSFRLRSDYEIFLSKVLVIKLAIIFNLHLKYYLFITKEMLSLHYNIQLPAKLHFLSVKQ